MAVGRAGAGLERWLLFRAGKRLCAVPLAYVVETMRVLPIERLAEAAGFVVGMSIVRGKPVPVVDIGALFDETPPSNPRLVTIDVSGRLVALAVDQVLGVHAIAIDLLNALPPLLRDATPTVVHAIGVLDGELLMRLEASRLVSETALEELGAAGPAA